MDYEKAYKEALDKLNEALAPKEGCDISGLTRRCIEDIFPELKETADERMRKAIIAYIKKANGEPNHILPSGQYSVLAMIFWLEKQGEQKATWSEEDEIGFNDTFWAIQQARTIAKDENDMGNLWYAEDWLKSLKERLS